MKKLLLIISVFLASISYSQNYIIRNDSVFLIAGQNEIFFARESALVNLPALFALRFLATAGGDANQTLIKNSNAHFDYGWGSITAAMVGLGNVNNTSDANKPVSTATATELALKASLSGSEVITNKTIGVFNYAADAGSNDTYVITLSPAPASLTTGMVIIFRANTANTTGCTINVNGLGAKNIIKRVSTTLATGDILALQFCWLVYNGTNFVIMNPTVN